MNAVGQLDQQRSHHARMQREKRVSVIPLAFALDIALQNALNDVQKIGRTDVCHADFKRLVAIQLGTPKPQNHQNSFQRFFAQRSSAEPYRIESVLKSDVHCPYANYFTRTEKKESTYKAVQTGWLNFHSVSFRSRTTLHALKLISWTYLTQYFVQYQLLPCVASYTKQCPWRLHSRTWARVTRLIS